MLSMRVVTLIKSLIGGCFKINRDTTIGRFHYHVRASHNWFLLSCEYNYLLSLAGQRRNHKKDC